MVCQLQMLSMDLRHQQYEGLLKVQGRHLLLQDLPAGALQQNAHEDLQVHCGNKGEGEVNSHQQNLFQLQGCPEAGPKRVC